MRRNAGRGIVRTSNDPPFGLDLSTAVFDRATRLAQALFDAAGASIILVHKGQIWRSRFADALPDDDPVTLSILNGGKLFWIEDGKADPRFADHPLVVGPPYLRFTVGVPIRLADGSTPGVLSVSSSRPQPYDEAKASLLQDIVDFVADEWERAQAVVDLAKSLQERNRALERIERSEERLTVALSLADLHVWELDFENKTLTKAGAEDTFFPVPQTYESLHRDLSHTVDKRDLPMVMAAWRAHLERGTPFGPEHRINRTDGKEVWVKSTMKAFLNAQGKPVRIVGALKNITARKIAEQALRAAKEESDAANRAKSNFLATMSHELRTPLNAILGFAELIEKQIVGPVPERYVGYAHDIYASGRHLLDLVNDVLDISKLEAGKVELHEEAFDLGELLGEVTTTFAGQAQSSGIVFRQRIAALPVLKADRRLIKQVLLNLLSNALKFTPSGGTVTLTAARNDGRGLDIAVCDSGIGMSASEIAVAVTPFGQVDSQIARRSKGTGLGLPISRALVALHGGELRVESEPGVGTCVTVVLPQSRVGTTLVAPVRSISS